MMEFSMKEKGSCEKKEQINHEGLHVMWYAAASPAEGSNIYYA